MKTTPLPFDWPMPHHEKCIDSDKSSSGSTQLSPHKLECSICVAIHIYQLDILPSIRSITCEMHRTAPSHFVICLPTGGTFLAPRRRPLVPRVCFHRSSTHLKLCSCSFSVAESIDNFPFRPRYLCCSLKVGKSLCNLALL